MSTVGPFLLQAPLGRGGMGEVWRGVHQPTGHPVAIKLVAPRWSAHPGLQAAFRREVRAVAALDHPAVVRVFDQGQVTAGEAAARPEALSPGAQWLAMELAGGGSLADCCGRLSWARIRELLEGLLGALAHAHAAGLLHRDVKPANVLLRGRAGAGAELLLTDFGLAHARRSAQAAESGRLSAGTPGYMAPEQAAAAWRDQGPWTDLFALGRLAWALVTGGPLAQPRSPLPAAFQAWVARCTVEDPARRFQRAADARRALDLVPALESEHIGGGRVSEGSSAPTLADWTGSDDGATVVLDELDLPSVGFAAPRVEPMASPPQELAADWRAVEAPLRAAPLRGAGLGLVGLRPVPLVGREAARDVLWRALGEAWSQHRTQAVLLRGPAGVGKSRLARWLTRRAHEQGVATVLEAVHSPSGGPADGLVPMLRQRIGLAELEPRAAMGSLAAWLRARGETSTYEWRALGTALELAGEQAVALSTAEERLQVLRRAMQRCAGERVALCWLDDAQWGGDARALARLALERADDSPVLLVLTARDEALAEAPEAEAELLALPGLEVLSLGPLDHDEARQAVGAIAGLDEQVVGRLVERTRGNPLFAIQLVRDWVERGVLVPGEEGYVLPPGTTLELPDDLHQIWLQRVDRLLARLPDRAGRALERAATLGAEVDGEEWAAASPESPDLRLALLETLLDQNLALSRGESGQDWAFVHGMLRESVLRRAAEAGRAAEHHRACAAVLSGPERAGRRSRHLEAAGKLDMALEALLDGIEHGLLTNRQLRLPERIAHGQVLAERLALSSDASLRLRLDTLRVRVRRISGDFEGTVELARQLAERLPDGAARAEVLGELGLILRLWGRNEEARTWLSQAVHLARLAGDLRTAVESEREIAYSWMRGGRAGPAEEAAERAAAWAEVLGDDIQIAECLRARATLARQRGDLELTERFAAEALGHYEHNGHVAGALDACNVLGDCARYRGDLDAAADAYQRAMEWLSRGELLRRDAFPRMNLSLVQLGRGRWQAALDILDGVEEPFRDTGQLGVVAVVEVLRASAKAGLEHPDTGALLARARARLEAYDVVEVDVAWAAEVAAEACSDPQLAAAFTDLARAQRAAGAGRSE